MFFKFKRKKTNFMKIDVKHTLRTEFIEILIYMGYKEFNENNYFDIFLELVSLDGSYEELNDPNFSENVFKFLFFCRK